MVANGGGYNNEAGVAWAAGSDSALVHNIYLLVGAETGYLGLLAFLFVYPPLAVAFRCGWRMDGDPRGDFTGLGVAL